MTVPEGADGVDVSAGADDADDTRIVRRDAADDTRIVRRDADDDTRIVRRDAAENAGIARQFADTADTADTADADDTRIVDRDAARAADLDGDVSAGDDPDSDDEDHTRLAARRLAVEDDHTVMIGREAGHDSKAPRTARRGLSTRPAGTPEPGNPASVSTWSAYRPPEVESGHTSAYRVRAVEPTQLKPSFTAAVSPAPAALPGTAREIRVAAVVRLRRRRRTLLIVMALATIVVVALAIVVAGAIIGL